ncbi:sodium transport ATPase 5 [Podospora aff. communis PSN243]|uniref:P-type Na(+) transporter n=1 Tax=Podospora aff. communis PSN243 TaxID=3040156 RepID=A0AAV9G8A7_9PEZI|nr:sodium transport ATPase 5 [Podospora aff. communis PSN243]
MGASKESEAEGHLSGQANEPMSLPAHCLSWQQVAQELGANMAAGLDSREADTRLAQYGANDLGQEKGVNALEILIAQVANAMTLILLLALAASFGIQAWVEGGVLAGLILINIVIGFIQDLQAARTIASLKSLNCATARVVRDGKPAATIEASKLVPGDIIELKVGDSVPADARVFEAVNLEADESLLTGESVPVRKDPSEIFQDPRTGPGDRLNVVFSSSVITKGRGRAIVFATGMCTEIGAIAAALGDDGTKKRVLKRDENGKASFGSYLTFAVGKVWDWVGEFLGLTVGTPLQRKLAQLFYYIFIFAVICAVIVLGANEFRTRNDVIIYAVATALGTLPVTLILVLTITMAAGTKVMVQRNVVVRNMRSLEALGGVTNICSDKTGTLTQGKMVARMAWIPNLGTYSVHTTNDVYNPEAGSVKFSTSEPRDMKKSSEHQGSVVDDATGEMRHHSFQHYLDVASLANLATVHKVNEDQWQANGDPTEIAIQVFATRFGCSEETARGWKQLAEFPFDSSVKKMSVLVQRQTPGEDTRINVFTKGAVERVLSSCAAISSAGNDVTIALTEEAKSDILANMEAMARRGLRVLALASKAIGRQVSPDDARQGRLKRDEFEQDLVFRGLIGIYDPPRPESRPSVFKCHQAGIVVHMLTGDHPETARAIAIEVGILPARMELVRSDIASRLVMAAHDFDSLSDDELDRLPELPLVVARCAPSTKVRMIDALHRRGRYVAMTGDGVNDSPSLKRADVGIAMGLGGSDVAKSASDIVLSDDNFASILNAVEEGRRIFDNVQKFMLHVLSANVAFVTTLMVGLAYKDRGGTSIFQITPVEILFMLLVAGAFTETGLGFESASKHILNRPPQSLKYGVFTPEFLCDLFAYGIIMAICLLSSFIVVIFGFYDGEFGQDCNLRYDPSCEGVFRARSTCYTAMMWIFVFFAWELVDSRLSFFHGAFRNTKAWARRLWKNPFLFWSVIVGFFSIFPTLYIPVLNRRVFLHTGIDKEWGIVFAVTILFFVGAEGYKWAKRRYLRRRGLMQKKGSGTDEEDLEKRVFDKFYSSESDLSDK